METLTCNARSDMTGIARQQISCQRAITAAVWLESPDCRGEPTGRHIHRDAHPCKLPGDTWHAAATARARRRRHMRAPTPLAFISSAALPLHCSLSSPCRSTDRAAGDGEETAMGEETTIVDPAESGKLYEDVPPMPLMALNHISRLCKSVDASVQFYVKALGFVLIHRPPALDFSGAWLFNYGVGIHLVQRDDARKAPDVSPGGGGELDPMDNHISFQCEDMGVMERRLREMRIRYMKRTINEEEGSPIDQLFFKDPDGFMIEICNCESLELVPAGDLGRLRLPRGRHNPPIEAHRHPRTHGRAKLSGASSSRWHGYGCLADAPAVDMVGATALYRCVRRPSLDNLLAYCPDVPADEALRYLEAAKADLGRRCVPHVGVRRAGHPHRHAIVPCVVNIVPRAPPPSASPIPTKNLLAPLRTAMQTLVLPDAAVAVAAADVTPRTHPLPHRVSVSPSRAPRRESDPKKRVVITGMGVVSVFGNDVGTFYDRLLAGESGAAHISRFVPTGFSTRFAAQIRNFSSDGHIDGDGDSDSDRRLDDCQRYALVAARKALESAGLALGSRAIDKVDVERAGVVVGSGIGGVNRLAAGVESLVTRGASNVSPFSVPLAIPNMASALVSIDAGIGFMGPNYSVSTACATGTHCILSAADQIRPGRADVMLAGGAEAAIAPAGLAGLAALGVLSRRNADPATASRPWDRDRDGFVLGEGAGVMESLEHAMRRGAPVLAEYLGGAASCDAYHVAKPRPDGRGVSLCIKRSLEDAGVAPEEVNYINANASSTLAGDMAEVKALKQVFKDTSQIKMNATKNPDPAVDQFDTVRDVKKRHQVNVALTKARARNHSKT
ncbi:hypothetical protein HU200_052182 [Digitaria exilis]|uniref:beta-ketoacyl-[acyl-carrier-protein] synthase I n=1 Tax=Digitaria exilis TaxID=1010633 RepID=A0A835APS0_9POAL|nr:hypothetical protein HU200_052182 [Digitaria exilis]